MNHSTNKPYAASCDQNKDAILAVIKPLLTHTKNLLEIGSGTGQHAVYFAEKLPQLSWQTSDVAEHLTGINSWLNEANLTNTPTPLTLDVKQTQWSVNSSEFDAIFSANTLHIMDSEGVVCFFKGAGSILKTQALLIVYGPFNYNNQYTSPSNAQFDLWLKQRGVGSGIRNFEDINKLAETNGFSFHSDTSMPANNRILCWQKN